MKVIFDDNLYESIWSKIYKEFKFQPSSDTKPFQFQIPYKVYKLKTIWNDRQETMVNNIFKQITNDEIYALDWQHDCFEYNPNEEIPSDYHYFDEERDCEVYFPSYYPNGDYYFFIAKDWSYGMLGHPWKEEIYVFGKELIDSFDEKRKELSIVAI